MYYGAWDINRSETEKTLAAFLDFLLEKGVLDMVELETFRSILQTRLMFGIIALRESYITPDQLQAVLELQTNGAAEMKIGELMIRQELMSRSQVDKVLALQKETGSMPPDVILDTGILPREILEEELLIFLKS